MAIKKEIESWQIKKLWSISKAIGMSKEDLYAMAAVESLHSLSATEANEVISRLEKLQGNNKPKPKQNNTGTTDSSADATYRKVWALMYELQKYDKIPSKASLGERLCGIIKKELQIDANPQKPFMWLNFTKLNKLIEIIKKYVANAKTKAEKGGELNGT